MKKHSKTIVAAGAALIICLGLPFRIFAQDPPDFSAAIPAINAEARAALEVARLRDPNHASAATITAAVAAGDTKLAISAVTGTALPVAPFRASLFTLDGNIEVVTVTRVADAAGNNGGAVHDLTVTRGILIIGAVGQLEFQAGSQLRIPQYRSVAAMMRGEITDLIRRKAEPYMATARAAKADSAAAEGRRKAVIEGAIK